MLGSLYIMITCCDDNNNSHHDDNKSLLAKASNPAVAGLPLRGAYYSYESMLAKVDLFMGPL